MIMETKFSPKQEVIYNGVLCTVICSKKDFSNNRITYRLSTNELVTEEVLVYQNRPEILAQEQEVKELSIKNEPENNKENTVPQGTEEGYEILKNLSRVQLEVFIRAKGLDIDPKDYKGKADLLIAVCEELNVQIP